MMIPKRICILFLAAALVPLVPVASGFQSRQERKAQQLAESEKPQSVAGGVTFQRSAGIDQTYDDLLNWIKREGYTLTSASKETGQMVTDIQVTGGYRQTGTRIFITTIKDSDTATTVRVAVSEQKRTKALQTEPWGTAKVNTDRSKELADKIGAALK